MVKSSLGPVLSDDKALLYFGPIIYQDAFSVVRVKTTLARGKAPHTHVAIHDKDKSGDEILPRGYNLGTNMVWLRNKH
jgi:hypothetical protein